jgi:hypothetical protein
MPSRGRLRTSVRIAAAALLASACAGAPTAVEESGLLQVDRLDVLVSSSVPARVSVRVHGVVGDGCTSLDSIAQRRDGSTVTVTITTLRRGEVCTQVAQLFDQTLTLEGEFAPGDYLVRVNGIEARFRVAG